MNLAKISIYFNPADPKQLKALNAFLKTTTVNEVQGVLTTTEQVNEVQGVLTTTEQVSEPAPAKAVPAKQPAKAKTTAKAAPAKAAETTNTVSLDDLRQLLTEKVKVGDNRATIKAALQERGAANLSSLGKEHYGDVYSILEGLDGA